jgi:hypothetical protein
MKLTICTPEKMMLFEFKNCHYSIAFHGNPNRFLEDSGFRMKVELKLKKLYLIKYF